MPLPPLILSSPSLLHLIYYIVHTHTPHNSHPRPLSSTGHLLLALAGEWLPPPLVIPSPGINFNYSIPPTSHNPLLLISISNQYQVCVLSIRLMTQHSLPSLFFASSSLHHLTPCTSHDHISAASGSIPHQYWDVHSVSCFGVQNPFLSLVLQVPTPITLYMLLYTYPSLLPISSLDSGLYTLLQNECIIFSWIRKETCTPFLNWTTHPTACQFWLHDWPALTTAHYTIQDVFQMNLMLVKPCVVVKGMKWLITISQGQHSNWVMSGWLI